MYEYEVKEVRGDRDVLEALRQAQAEGREWITLETKYFSSSFCVKAGCDNTSHNHYL